MRAWVQHYRARLVPRALRVGHDSLRSMHRRGGGGEGPVGGRGGARGMRSTLGAGGTSLGGRDAFGGGEDSCGGGGGGPACMHTHMCMAAAWGQSPNHPLACSTPFPSSGLITVDSSLHGATRPRQCLCKRPRAACLGRKGGAQSRCVLSVRPYSVLVGVQQWCTGLHIQLLLEPN